MLWALSWRDAWSLDKGFVRLWAESQELASQAGHDKSMIKIESHVGILPAGAMGIRSMVGILPAEAMGVHDSIIQGANYKISQIRHDFSPKISFFGHDIS